MDMNRKPSIETAIVPNADIRLLLDASASFKKPQPWLSLGISRVGKRQPKSTSLGELLSL